MTALPPHATEPVSGATHYCVVCAARWLKRPDDTWSLVTADCGPCCDNVPMDVAPIVAIQADGSMNGKDRDRVKAAYQASVRQKEVDRYRGIACAICDEPFENHAHNWACPHSVPPRFKFPARAAQGDPS